MLSTIGLRMMDFGFGAFLEKFEQRFGNFATTILLGLIGLTVVTACMSLIYKTAMEPAIATFNDLLIRSDSLDQFYQFVSSYLSSAIGLGLGILSMSYFAFPRALKRVECAHREAEKGLREVQDILKQTDALYDEALAKNEVIVTLLEGNVKDGDS